VFEDQEHFRPVTDSKVPLRRTRLALSIRGMAGVVSLLASRHPWDCAVWLKSMWLRRHPLSLPLPWLAFGAIRALERELSNRPEPTVFEYGAGHSTLFWVKQGATVFSVEDNDWWFRAVMDRLRETGESRAHLVLAQGADYVTTIRRCGIQSFDIVLVDGALRRECVLEAVSHVAPGGILVVDNTDWHWFHEHPLEGIPSEWKRTVYAGYAPMLGHKTETTIWRRTP
jgi:hypothetical protein